jgi:hypothetical protein
VDVAARREPLGPSGAHEGGGGEQSDGEDMLKGASHGKNLRGAVAKKREKTVKSVKSVKSERGTAGRDGGRDFGRERGLRLL